MNFERPQVMGILNVTPDSFSDGGRYTNISSAVEKAMNMEAAGASIIDIGGESTRPGSQPISLEEELIRVLPVIEEIRRHSNVTISIDTSKAEVMEAAVKSGANMVNDVWALRQPNALEMVSSLGVPVCLMHMQANPETMQNDPNYGHVVDEVKQFFDQRINACVKAGVGVDNIIIDPGFGFGKSLENNLCLLKNLDQFETVGRPILVGLSRKSMLGQILNKKVDERTEASVATSLLAVTKGASIVRVHDVAETVDALTIYNALQDVG